MDPGNRATLSQPGAAPSLFSAAGHQRKSALLFLSAPHLAPPLLLCSSAEAPFLCLRYVVNKPSSPMPRASPATRASLQAKPAAAQNHPEPPGVVCFLSHEDLTAGSHLRPKREAISSSPGSVASPSTSPTTLPASSTHGLTYQHRSPLAIFIVMLHWAPHCG
jgi:hypothetical protein